MNRLVTVFAGPSVPSEQRRRHAVNFCRPVRHGDLWRLQPGRRDVIVVIDGLYQQYAPLRHQEIRWAVSQGATVVGAASYGALRAAELRYDGMIPIGKVAAAYVDGTLTEDADVAVLHTDDDECRTLTVPFVSILFATRDLHDRGLISDRDRDQINTVGRRLHFTQRSAQALRALCEKATLPAMNLMLGHLSHGGDVKRNDADAAIDWAVRLVSDDIDADTADADTPSLRYSSYTVQEQFEVSPVRQGTDVSGREVLAALQLFATDFADRHRSYVERICGLEHDQDALSVLQAAGFAAEGTLAGPYARPTRETLCWPPAARVLVRTFRLPPGRLTYSSLVPEAIASRRLDELIRWCGATRSRRPASRLDSLDALRQLWSVQHVRDLQLTCLDRGFRNITEAVEWLMRFDVTVAAGKPL